VANFISKVIDKLRQWYQAYILKNPDALLAQDFLKKDKKMDFRHRYTFGLNPVIFDCGGHNGDWTFKMFNMYRDQNPRIYVFEIVGSFILHLRKRFYNNQDVQILDFGLGDADKEITFSVSSIATSIFSNPAGSALESGKIRDVVEFLEENSIERIDLLKMNIEGGEYDLLDRLVTSGVVKSCRNIQIQFHNYGEWSKLKRDELKEELRRTHVCTYDFEWTFENWQLKEPQ
jgi:FkbM family methyltransferase